MKNTDHLSDIIFKINKLLEVEKSHIVIAIDGRSGSGKSTIAKIIGDQFNSAMITGDDFCFGDNVENKTAQEKVALCIDWRRLRREALDPLLSGHSVNYHPFNFERGHGLSEKIVHLESAKLIILDGAYSARPELSDLMDIKILVQLSDSERRVRLLAREGDAFMKNWHAIWDEAEDYYFNRLCQPSYFDFVIDANDRT